MAFSGNKFVRSWFSNLSRYMQHYIIIIIHVPLLEIFLSLGTGKIGTGWKVNNLYCIITEYLEIHIISIGKCFSTRQNNFTYCRTKNYLLTCTVVVKQTRTMEIRSTNLYTFVSLLTILQVKPLYFYLGQMPCCFVHTALLFTTLIKMLCTSSTVMNLQF